MPINRYEPKFKTKQMPDQRWIFVPVIFPTAALAQILDRIIPDKILVPAKQANFRIGLRSRSSTLSRIVKCSGFVMKR
jgi:hypothetical protein